jgi:hypothetical protein
MLALRLLFRGVAPSAGQRAMIVSLVLAGMAWIEMSKT